MMAAIYFEAEFQIRAIEIDDVIADWMLPAELVTAQLSVAQKAPDHILLGRQLAPRGPRESPEARHRMGHQSRGYLGVVAWCPPLPPPGTPSPPHRRGKGRLARAPGGPLFFLFPTFPGRAHPPTVPRQCR